MAEQGDIRLFNPNKEISKEITLEILIRHRDSMKQARTGEKPINIDKISDDARKFNQVRALNLIIAAQREMITISRPVIYHNSFTKWKKRTKEEELNKKKFEKDDNDYNRMLYWLKFLRACEKDILHAEKTKTIDDDFIIKKENSQGETKWELTDNFYEMLEELESSYEQIYLLMLTNKIVSAGIEEDEELTYKEQEQAFIERVKEA